MRTLLTILILALVLPVLGNEPVSLNTNGDWIPVVQHFDGVPMVLVPAGCFNMGSAAEQVDEAYRDFVHQFSEDSEVRKIFNGEMPQHKQCFAEAFWMDQFPVTQGDFARLNGQKSNADRFVGANRPVEIINWFEANRFCEVRGGRLPSEAEWEWAARGPDNLIYPWGNEWNEDYLVWNRDESQGTADVGSIPEGASWVGAQDFLGNVWEWTLSIYDQELYPYPYDANDGRNLTEIPESKRVLKGGAWSSITVAAFRAAYRTSSRPQSRYYSLGFRCMRPA